MFTGSLFKWVPIELVGYRKIKRQKKRRRRRIYNSLFSVLVVVCGNGRATQILCSEPRDTIHAKKHFQNPCYHWNLNLLYFNIHHYSVEGQELKVQLDARRWIAVVEVLLNNLEVSIKKGLKTEGISAHSTWTIFIWYYRWY